MFSRVSSVFPNTALVRDGELVIDGVSTASLVAVNHTPVTAISAGHVRTCARAWRDSLADWPTRVEVHYACKALATIDLLRLMRDEGLGADVASAGELAVALEAGIAGEHIVVHGNNKRSPELAAAVTAGVAHIVVDAEDELALLEQVARDAGRVQPILVRVNPDIVVETHEYIATAHAGSKFGVASDTALRMLARADESEHLVADGVHVHLGSQLLDLDSWHLVIDWLAAFATRAAAAGTPLRALDIGGGLGIAYLSEQQPPTIAETGACIVEAITRTWAAAGLALPELLIVEPGRSIIGSAGVTLYEVGVVKDDGPIRYVNVDGGMSDNPRPMLYKARYTALVANRADDEPTGTWWIAGLHCESGDVLVEDAPLADPRRGDVIAIAATGAYTVSMGSNYNMTPRGAVVLVDGGSQRVLLRAETVEDLLSRDAAHFTPGISTRDDDFEALVTQVTTRLLAQYPQHSRSVIAAATGAAMVGLNLSDRPSVDDIARRARAALEPETPTTTPDE